MRNSSQLVSDAEKAIQKDNYGEVCDILCEALGHLSDFSWRTGETWDRDTVRDCCNEIGELIYDDGGLSAMQDVYRAIYTEMKGIAARYLEHFWDGCGDGEWRG